MSITVPVQTRLDAALAKAIDARAKEAGTTRAEVVRAMLEAALAEPLPATASPTAPLLDNIADAIGIIAGRVDAILDATRKAEHHAAAAHATARLGALMMLPISQQQAFVDKLGKAVQS